MVYAAFCIRYFEGEGTQFCKPNIGNFEIVNFRICDYDLLYEPAISQSDCKKAGISCHVITTCNSHCMIQNTFESTTDRKEDFVMTP